MGYCGYKINFIKTQDLISSSQFFSWDYFNFDDFVLILYLTCIKRSSPEPRPGRIHASDSVEISSELD